MSNELTCAIDIFADVPQSLAISLVSLPARLKAVSVLAIASEKGLEWMACEEIARALQQMKVPGLADTIRKALVKRGTDIAVRSQNKRREFKVLHPGLQAFDKIRGVGTVSVLHVSGIRPFTDRKKTEDILGGLTGEICICDQYFSVDTFDLLSNLSTSPKVRFLAGQIHGEDKVRRRVNDYKREFENFELRIAAPGAGLHDRYLLGDSSLILVGQSLKDLGRKESFVTQFDKSNNPDLIAAVGAGFSKKWGSGTLF